MNFGSHSEGKTSARFFGIRIRFRNIITTVQPSFDPKLPRVSEIGQGIVQGRSFSHASVKIGVRNEIAFLTFVNFVRVSQA